LPSGWSGVLLGALIYAALQSTDPLTFLPTLFLGLATATCFRSTAKLWPAVLVHVLYNIGMIRLFGVTTGV
jgi:membrane protease YdiL (CAAX protease family)